MARCCHAMVVRLFHLKMLKWLAYRNLCISLSENGYRSSEPNGISHEQSQILTKVLDALRSEGTSRQSVARQLAITTAEFNSLLSGLVMAPVSTVGTNISRENRWARVSRPWVFAFNAGTATKNIVENRSCVMLCRNGNKNISYFRLCSC